jgi:hypothetical protein
MYEEPPGFCPGSRVRTQRDDVDCLDMLLISNLERVPLLGGRGSRVQVVWELVVSVLQIAEPQVGIESKV